MNDRNVNHGRTTAFAELGVRLLLAAVLTAGGGAVASDATIIHWYEDFDSPDWANFFHTDFGVWAVAPPTAGPGATTSAPNCAATNPGGNYHDGVTTRLIRHVRFVVPTSSENPRLRFWHWYNFSSSDSGWVEVRTVGGEWTRISDVYSNYSSVWTYASIDLSGFAGEEIELSFHFTSRNYGGGSQDVAQGWYVDDVALISGTMTFPALEDFEEGLGSWRATRGVWQVGVPESGPYSAHSGEQVAATVLRGNYYDYQDSRLVSPSFVVPAPSEEPWLRFWHWYNFSSSDSGRVEIRPEGGSWAQVSNTYTNYSSIWSYTGVDLTAYAGQRIEVAFRFQSSNYGGGSIDVTSGWYIDDVSIETGHRAMPNPEDFENDYGYWWVTRGVWEIGIPESGPGAAHSGERLAATVLKGKYYDYQDSRLISPPLAVPPDTANPVLRFWHYHSFSSSDAGWVEIRRLGESWEVVSPKYTGGSGGWFFTYLPIPQFAGDTIEVSFRFQSNNYGGGSIDVSSGWYIDDVVIEPVLIDCNGNGVADSEDIATGESEDANGNGIPDECEIPPAPRFVRGDVDGDSLLTIGDPIRILSALFVDPDGIECRDAADANDSGAVNVSDAVTLLDFMFLGASPPAAPWPECGEDTTDDDLACATYEACL